MNKADLAPPKEFSVEVAIEKGVEGFYEMVFYTIAIGLPIMEYNKSVVATRLKDREVLKELSVL